MADAWLNRIVLISLGAALVTGIAIIGVTGSKGVQPSGELCTLLGGIVGALSTAYGLRKKEDQSP